MFRSFSSIAEGTAVADISVKSCKSARSSVVRPGLPSYADVVSGYVLPVSLPIYIDCIYSNSPPRSYSPVKGQVAMLYPQDAEDEPKVSTSPSKHALLTGTQVSLSVAGKKAPSKKNLINPGVVLKVLDKLE